jgi:hypothetical protein
LKESMPITFNYNLPPDYLSATIHAQQLRMNILLRRNSAQQIALQMTKILSNS